MSLKRKMSLIEGVVVNEEHFIYYALNMSGFYCVIAQGCVLCDKEQITQIIACEAIDQMELKD